ncbi:MAG TPA: hypothetical protein VKU61_11830, partial [Candidatus Binatia bacterium]|nr:hypothetical protein [Candidatus Binatia bacterium]
MGLLLAIGLQRPARAELILERTLAAPSPMSGAQFGSDVAFSGSEGIVGAPAGGSLPGAAFAFQGDPLTSLTHAPQPGDEAGFAVAAAGDDVVVGVPGVRVDAGTAYVYDASGNFLTELLRPATAAGDHFGFAVAVSANRIVVGAPGASTNGQADAGAVYLFDGDRSSPTFGHPLATAMLAKPGGAVAGDEFGAAVAVGESSIFVGAPFDGGTGAVYVFDLNGHYTGHMLQGEMPAAGDLFGAAVAAYQGGVLVGAPLEDRPAVDAGAAYFFDATFQMQRRFTGDPSDPGDEFGASVAGFGTRVVIGAPLADRTFVDQGVVQIFDPTLGDQTLVSPTPSTDGRFGAAVATGDTRVVIGAPHEVGQEGRAHVFTPSLCVTPEGGPVICNDNNACTTEACNGLT